MNVQRVDIFLVAIDAAGPLPVQVPAGNYRSITVCEQTFLHSVKWTAVTGSGTWLFSIGFMKEFKNGPYAYQDVLGLAQLDTGSGYLVLFCEY